MAEIKLKIKERKFPSHGRVRIHESRLAELNIAEGDSVDLINESAKKSVTATVIADRMVGEGEVRVSTEDLAALGLKEGAIVTVKRTPPLKEKVGKAADEAGKSLSEGAGKLDEAVRKTGETVSAEAAKHAETVKKQTQKATESVKAGAAKTAEAVKAGSKKAADTAGKVAGDTTAAVKKHLKKKDEL